MKIKFNTRKQNSVFEFSKYLYGSLIFYIRSITVFSSEMNFITSKLPTFEDIVFPHIFKIKFCLKHTPANDSGFRIFNRNIKCGSCEKVPNLTFFCKYYFSFLIQVRKSHCKAFDFGWWHFSHFLSIKQGFFQKLES